MGTNDRWRLAFVLLLAAAEAAASFNFSFSFSSFPEGSCGPGGKLKCFQSSTVQDGHIALTREDGPDVNAKQVLRDTYTANIGRVLYTERVIRWPASFNTTFTVRMLQAPNASSFGDGLAFIMTSHWGPSPNATHSSLLGLFDNGGKAAGQLAVEIDTHQDKVEELIDPDGDHVGVDVECIVSKATALLSNVGVDPRAGNPITFKIDYDGWSKNLEVFAGYANGSSPLRSLLNFTFVIAKMEDPPVYVGFTAAVPLYAVNRVINWTFSSTELPASSLDEPHGSTSLGVVIAAVASGVVGAPLLGLLVFLGARGMKERRRRRSLDAMSRSAAGAPKFYTYGQLARATRNFSSANLVGRGGFGAVYRGHISRPPSVVAVKKISATSQQGEREYFAEICTIGRLRHRNIVQLQGWCHSGKSLLLVYQFLPNGSLDRHLAAGTLNWPMRRRVLVGLASALLYLHEECGGTVVHRDVKPNNVLLDADFNAYLGDFGLARLLEGTRRSTATTIMAGTVGYVAPECGYTGKATPESDVFSYGVVVLEVVSGRRSILGDEHNNLLDHAWDLYMAGELLQAVDPRLDGLFDEEEARRILLMGLMCAHPSAAKRPKIRKALSILVNPDEPLVEMPACRPESEVGSPMVMFKGGAKGMTSSILSSRASLPQESSPDISTTALIAR